MNNQTTNFPTSIPVAFAGVILVQSVTLAYCLGGAYSRLESVERRVTEHDRTNTVANEQFQEFSKSVLERLGRIEALLEQHK